MQFYSNHFLFYSDLTHTPIIYLFYYIILYYIIFYYLVGPRADPSSQRRQRPDREKPSLRETVPMKINNEIVLNPRAYDNAVFEMISGTDNFVLRIPTHTTYHTPKPRVPKIRMPDTIYMYHICHIPHTNHIPKIPYAIHNIPDTTRYHQLTRTCSSASETGSTNIILN